MKLRSKETFDAICYDGKNIELVEQFCHLNGIIFEIIEDSTIYIDGEELKLGNFIIMLDYYKGDYDAYVCDEEYIKNNYEIVY